MAALIKAFSDSLHMASFLVIKERTLKRLYVINVIMNIGIFEG